MQKQRERERPIGSFGYSIVRVEHRRDFVTIANDTVRDAGLSFELRGFLAYLLSQSETWQVRPEVVARENGVSVRTVYRLLSGLIAARHVQREILMRRHPETGRFESVSFYVVHERPQDVDDGKRGGLRDADIPF